MPPKQKVPLDKVAWEWADTVDSTQLTAEHVKKAYRLDLAACEPGLSKRNCKGIPFCLHSLGEKKWLVPVDKVKVQSFDVDGVRRQKGDFVGLKNLGATCYVNTFLQVWFHNTSVRKAVYEWRSPNLPDQYREGWKPDSICGHLQVIFALLQLSKRRSVDPGPFIECLGLDAGEQQDAQEFSKLFLHVLENSLYGNGMMRTNVIQEQFCGRYCYVTVCQNCGSQSETPATFYELDLNIRGHPTLAASIKDFLQEEKLEGDNRYMCNVCNSKQNATRMIRLKRLPPILNFQLLRFVFDKMKGHKKKLSSFIQFPETLDMSPYVEKVGDESVMYELTAVLIHGGPSAFSGHYIAHIREPMTGAWYKFNDDDIDKVNNKSLELGKEDDPVAEGSSEKAPKASKGSHTSRYAYMLVYQRCKPKNTVDTSQAVSASQDLLPVAVRGYVDNDNAEFENWILQMLHEQHQNLQDVKQLHQEMKALYLSLPVKSLDEPWEWVSAEWLSKWLANPATVGKVENKVSFCPHNKLLPEDVIKMKCINSEGADFLFAKYPINRRYPGESLLCDKCTIQKCREIQFRNCMTDDDKLFSCSKNVLTIDPGEEYFWVSTKHLRSWKKFAIGEIAMQSESAAASQVMSGDLLAQSSSSDHAMDTSDDCSSSNPSEHVNQTKCKNLESDFMESGNPDFEIFGSSLLVLSSTASNQSSTSNQRHQINHMQTTPALDSSCTNPANSQSNSLEQFCSSTKNADPDGRRVLKQQQSSSSCKRSSSSLNGDLHVSAGDVQSCSSPESDTVVLTKTMDCDDCIIYDFTEASSSEANSTQAANDINNCVTPHEGNNGTCVRQCNKDRELVQEESEKLEAMDIDADDVDSEREEKFSDDILCEHGNLRIDESGRRLVSKVVWERLLYYFPHLKPFTQNSPICEICLAHQDQEQQLKRSRKLAGQGQKDELPNLYHGKSRPKIGESWEGRTAFIVSSNFVECWRKFVKPSKKSDLVQEIVNAPLLCEHNLLLYKPEDMNSPDNATGFTLVWKNEWEKLINYYEYDVEIQVVQLVEPSGQVCIVTLPGVCSTCLNERIRQEEEGKFIFSRENIYIRKIADGMVAEQKGEDSKENGKGYNYDPEFSAPLQQRSNKARGISPPPEKQMKLDAQGQRKSTRHRKTRGEKELIVSSSMTLKELKILLYNSCGVPPFDQNLSLDGRILKSDDATLQDLRVYPNCVIFLKADEPTGEATSSVDDYLNIPTRPEEGFKGTNLLGR